jgi:hypothetical protein
MSLRRDIDNYGESIVPSTRNTATASTGGVSFLGLAFAVLLTLKIAGEAGASWGLANLSWWWVFAPVWIGFALVALILVVILVIGLLVAIFGK